MVLHPAFFLSRSAQQLVESERLHEYTVIAIASLMSSSSFGVGCSATATIPDCKSDAMWPALSWRSTASRYDKRPEACRPHLHAAEAVVCQTAGCFDDL